MASILPFQSAIVTGASSGIGYQLAYQLGMSGVSLGLIARRLDPLLQLADKIKQDRQKQIANSNSITSLGESQTTISSEVPVYCRSMDVTCRDDMLSTIHELQDKLGGCELLIANAGVGSGNSGDNLNLRGAEQVIRVNLLGVMNSIQGVLPQMLRNHRGQIVAISSIASIKGVPGAAAYCASKAAVNAYMESLRIEHYGSGVSFQTICPGFIDTPMTKKNKKMFLVMTPERAAQKIIRAIQKKKKFYAFPWSTHRLMRLTYWLPDWLLHRTMPNEIGGVGAD